MTYDDATIARLTSQHGPYRAREIVCGRDAATNADLAAWDRLRGRPLNGPAIVAEGRARQSARCPHAAKLKSRRSRLANQAARRAMVAKLFRLGVEPAFIAERIGVSAGTVRADIAVVIYGKAPGR